MPQHKSALKRLRRTERRTLINHARLGRIRTFIKKVEVAIGGGEKETATAAFREMQPELMRGAGKGVVTKNAASRKLARLSARIKAMAT